MSKQSFTAIEREAIYTVYNKKCFYTGEFLDLNNFHIDHLIPEALNAPEKKDELKSTLEYYCLPYDFDVLSFKNLVPSKPSINSMKSDMNFNKNAMLVFLNLAASNEQKIIDTINKYKRMLGRGFSYFKINSLFSSGKITQQEALDLIKKHASSDRAKIEILKELEFNDYDDVKLISKDDVDDLRKKVVKVGNNEVDHKLVMTSPYDSEDKKVISTCEEYDKALSEGYYSFTTYDMKMEAWFRHQCGLLQALKKSSIPTRSYMSDPNVSILDISRLPYSLFPSFTEDDDNSNESYQDKVDSSDLVIKRISSNSIHLENNIMGQVLIEIFRADLNNDGIEDVFLYEYSYAIGGSFGAGDIKIISILNEGGMFSLI